MRGIAIALVILLAFVFAGMGLIVLGAVAPTSSPWRGIGYRMKPLSGRLTAQNRWSCSNEAPGDNSHGFAGPSPGSHARVAHASGTSPDALDRCRR